MSSPPQDPPTQPKQWTRPRQGHEVFSTQPWVTSSGWLTSSENKRDWNKIPDSPSPPPSPKKHKSEVSHPEQQAGEGNNGPDNDSQPLESLNGSESASSSSKEKSEQEDEDAHKDPQTQAQDPPLRALSAPPELPPAKENSILDKASVLLASFEERETESAPPDLPSEDDHWIASPAPTGVPRTDPLAHTVLGLAS